MMHGWGGMMGGWGLLGGLFGLFLFLLFVAAAVVLIVWLVRRSAPGSTGSPRNQAPTAREILAQRYARGEITREQYLSMRADLE